MVREHCIRDVPLENVLREQLFRRHKPVQLEKALDVLIDQDDFMIRVDGVKPDGLASIHQQNNIGNTAGAETSGNCQMDACPNAAFFPFFLESLERYGRVSGFRISAAATLTDEQMSFHNS